tara:strand:+ start:16173 stop:18611 length:2439 start_codon:yes stop_codon:yes gene_type:complete
MANSLDGHTDGANEGLVDGSHIISPSFTNLYELARGNGILLLEDAVADDGDRNTPANLPGAIATTGDAHIVQVRGGHAVIDNVLYNFCGGDGSTANITINSSSSNLQGSTTALTSGQECIFVVYLCTDGNNNSLRFEQGTPVTTASAFPTTPKAFLKDPLSSLTSKQSFVIATIRATYNGSAAAANDLKITISEINDKRGYIRPSPIYFAPLTGDSSASVDSHTDLDNFHAAANTETGDLTTSSLGAMWMSRGPDDPGQSETNDVLYFSGFQDGNRRTFRLGPDKLVNLPSSGGTTTFTFDAGTSYRLATDVATTLNPTGTFPSGHTIAVANANSSGATNNITFDASGLNDTIVPTESAIYSYNADGSAWVRMFNSTTTSTSSDGASGRVQLSDGSSGFTSSANLSFNTSSNELTVNGKLTVTGLIDPTGLELTPQSSNPVTGGTAGNTLWLDSTDSNRLYQGSTKILQVGDSVASDLNSLSAGVVDVATDSFGFIDSNDSNNSKKETIADLATAMAGTGISASSGVFNLDANQAGITSIGPAGTLTVNQDLTITGNLTVSGTTTTVDTATLNVEDINLTLGNGVGNDAAVNGGGITLDSSDGDKTILFSDANDAWELNLHTLPSADSTYDLGTTLIRWRAGYFDTVYGAGNFTTITGSGDVTIDTNVLKVDTTTDRVGVGQASPDATFQVKETGFGYGSTTDASTSTSTAIDVTLFDRTKFRAAKLLVEVENTTDGVFEVAEMILTHNGTSGAGATGASLTTYAVAQSDASETAQGTYDAGINGSNVELQVTPLHNLKNMTVKVSWQAITI